MSDGAQVNGFGEGVAAPPAARRTIPFDYVFRFDGELTSSKASQAWCTTAPSISASRRRSRPSQSATASCRK